MMGATSREPLARVLAHASMVLRGVPAVGREVGSPWTISSTRLSKRFELPSLIDFQRIVVHAIVHASNCREKVCAGLRGAEVEYHIDSDSSAV
jgi:hypothetical protein